MKQLVVKHLPKSAVFGAIMTVIGFFRGDTVMTFPPVWPDLLRLFLIYGGVFLAVNVLTEWIQIKCGKK